MTDADRAANAIKSLENDYMIAQQSPILARLAADMDAVFNSRARLGDPLPIGAGAGSSYDIEETIDAQDRETDPEFAFCYGDRNG